MSESNGTVRVVPIGDLLPDVANVRRRDDRARAALRASLRQFGPARSIVLDAKGIVRAGNGTLEAAQAEGVDEVLVVRPKTGQLVAVERDDWSPTEAVAYSVGDNHIGDMATDDQAGLAEVLRSLQSEGFDLDAIGFTGEEVDRLIEGLAGDLVDDPEGEWQGMPEFEHEDQTSQFRAIVHFASEADMRAFEDLVGQKIPTNTQAIWYPKAERQVVKGSGYVSDEA